MGRLTLSFLLVAGCSADDNDTLDSSIRCGENGECPPGTSCLVDECIPNGSLEIGETCLVEDQCGEMLLCHNFLCKPGCSLFYQVDDCPDGEWCKPLPDASPPAGSCAPSECDPAATDFCDADVVCVAFAVHTGGCLPYCEYGFSGGAYQDSCVDTFDNDLACQMLGVNHAPVCLTGGDSDTAPATGEPGCHVLANPCLPGSICVDVVCRELCFVNEPNACEVGESCVPIGSRADIAYCRAD